jgi:malonate-semialdehyde dehydrogenase (acetylating) / methylmalonate-semialdehyde dehydrogenase
LICNQAVAIGKLAQAELVIDGRNKSFPDHEGGFFLWPTLIDHVTSSMKSYQEEIFGPVLQIARLETFKEALSYPSDHHQGNAVSIYMQRGRGPAFCSRVPMPVLVSYHSFGGWKDSAFGDLINMARTASASSRGPNS